MPSDIQIAQSAEMLPITEIAKTAVIDEDDLELYGRYKAKISWNAINSAEGLEDGKLILVTAITPTPAGEGKTTVSVGLADALSLIGKKTMLALREPSLGPVFGMKGGAAGGGYSQVVPMEDINLHFTGDLHAITSAINLLAAMIDNHIYQGNALNIDPRRIQWRRSVDMNDRQLRNIVSGLGGKANGYTREDSFQITVASEVMAIFCLARSIDDLKNRLSKINVGFTTSGDPVTAGDLKAAGAMTALLKDALKPNLVQTLGRTPAIIHGGPFANIAHGCNSVVATRYALKKADYVVTEAGFGADLGAEKFLDIKCASQGLKPAACVIVATIRALKHHGGGEDLSAVAMGCLNLFRHIDNMKNKFKLNTVVAINRFTTDTDSEIGLVSKLCEEYGVKAVPVSVWSEGGKGGIKLAEKVAALCEKESRFTPVYQSGVPLKEKLRTLVCEIYGGSDVVLSPAVSRELARLEKLGYGQLPICVAKTQYSFSDNPKLLGAPKGFEVTIREVRLSAGAGFIVAYAGDIMTMPGLPKVPAAEAIDVDSAGNILGLF
jgi:formate--tetrahydrofolate ligase